MHFVVFSRLYVRFSSMPITPGASFFGNELLLASETDCSNETLKDSPNPSEIGEFSADLSSVSSYILEENVLLQKWNQTKRQRHWMKSRRGWLLYMCCAIIALIVIGSVALLIITHDHKNSDGCEPTVLQFLKPGFEQALPDSSKCDIRIEEKLKEKMLEIWNHFSSVQVACESRTIFSTIVDQAVDKLYDERCAESCERRITEHIKEHRGVDKCYETADSLRSHLKTEFILCSGQEIAAALNATKSVWLPMQCKKACLPKLENYIKYRYVDRHDCYKGRTTKNLEHKLAADFTNCATEYIHVFIEHEATLKNKSCHEICDKPLKKEALAICKAYPSFKCQDQIQTSDYVARTLQKTFLSCDLESIMECATITVNELCKSV